jgi:hypothetical protein
LSVISGSEKIVTSRLTAATNIDKTFVSKLKLRVAKQRDPRKELAKIIDSEVHREYFIASELGKDVLRIANSANCASLSEYDGGIDTGEVFENVKGFFGKDNFTHRL